MLPQPAPGITPVDTFMTGRPEITCAYLIHSTELTLVETGPATSADRLASALTDLGVAPDDLAHVILTHVHLDHAGGAGHLARRFPKATFTIHESVAKHLVDPARLVASAARIYGDDRLRETFGIPEPVPAERVRGLVGGEELQLGDRSLRAMHTPGHAFGHLALQDPASDVVMTGDAVGVHLPGIDTVRPAAPPPEFDLEAMLTSIRLIESRAKGSLLFAHFGPTSDVEEICSQAAERVQTWADAVHTGIDRNASPDEIEASLRRLADEQERALDDGDRERFELLGSVRLNALGMSRYFTKLREASDQPSVS